MVKREKDSVFDGSDSQSDLILTTTMIAATVENLCNRGFAIMPWDGAGRRGSLKDIRECGFNLAGFAHAETWIRLARRVSTWCAAALTMPRRDTIRLKSIGE
jgi:hypothetical protein